MIKYLTFELNIQDNFVRIKCNALNIDLADRTLGQAIKHLGNVLKRKKVIELKQALA